VDPALIVDRLDMQIPLGPDRACSDTGQCFFTIQMKAMVAESTESDTVTLACFFPWVVGLPEPAYYSSRL
jgi:hypothetical protein